MNAQGKKQDNIFKWLRLTKTQKTVMQGKDKAIPVQKPLSGAELAKELNISPTTLREAEDAEKIENVSLPTITAYRNYFNVSYSTLFGETDVCSLDNLSIHRQLGLSNNCISTIKGLSPVSLAMLNVFMGSGKDTETFLYRLASITFSIVNILEENGNNKNNYEYQKMRTNVANLFLEYMHIFKMSDFRRVLKQIETQRHEDEKRFEDEEHARWARDMEDFFNSGMAEEYMKERMEEEKEFYEKHGSEYGDI